MKSNLRNCKIAVLKRISKFCIVIMCSISRLMFTLKVYYYLLDKALGPIEELGKSIFTPPLSHVPNNNV